MMRQIFTISLIGMFCIFVPMSCADSPSVVRNFPPQLPSGSSMAITFSNFGELNSNAKQSEELSVNNFAQATFTISSVKSLIEKNLIVPQALLEAASDADSRVNEKDKWEWNYRAFAKGNSYSTRLIASPYNDDAVQWKFYASNLRLGLDDQLIFSGITDADNRGGSWTYYNLKNTNSKEAVLKIKWRIDQEKVHLRLEVITNRFEREGDFIEYTINGDVKSVTYYDASKDKTTEVQWNADTNIGYVFSPQYNKGHQACWNEKFVDTPCDEL